MGTICIVLASKLLLERYKSPFCMVRVIEAIFLCAIALENVAQQFLDPSSIVYLCFASTVLLLFMFLYARSRVDDVASEQMRRNFHEDAQQGGTSTGSLEMISGVPADPLTDNDKETLEALTTPTSYEEPPKVQPPPSPTLLPQRNRTPPPPLPTDSVLPTNTVDVKQ
jgi:hypothetical protein